MSKIDPISAISYLLNHLQKFPEQQKNKTKENVEEIQRKIEEEDVINVRPIVEILEESYFNALSKNTAEELEEAYIGYNLVVFMAKNINDETKSNHITALKNAYLKLKK